MQISWNWLKTLVDIEDYLPQYVFNKLILAGFEIENIEKYIIADKEDITFNLVATVNRPDMFNMIGIAREIGIILNRKVYNLATNNLDINFSQNITLIDDENIANCYIGTFIENLSLISTPTWITNRLIVSNIPIYNNIYDILNYVTLEYGQTFLVIDFDILLETIHYPNQLKYQIKPSNNNEIFTHFNHENSNLLPLSNQNVVVTVNDYPISIAGIINNNLLNISSSTKRIYIETSIFNPKIIAQSSKSLKIETDISIRQIRGLNITQLETAHQRLLDLIHTLKIGTIASCFISKKEKIIEPIVTLDYNFIHKILGPTSESILSYSNITDLLIKIGCKVQVESNNFLISIPSYRANDLTTDIDIIEEIARLNGVNQFIDILPKLNASSISLNREFFMRKIQGYCKTILGLTEIITFSLVKSDPIKLKNPINTECSSLRSSILLGVLKTCQHNITQDNHMLECFEIGNVFNPHTYNQELLLAGVLGNKYQRYDWHNVKSYLTWYEIKGTFSSFFQHLHLNIKWIDFSINKNNAYYLLMHPKRSAQLIYEGQTIGYIGKIHPKISRFYSLPKEIYIFELKLDLLYKYYLEAKNYPDTFIEYSNYPSIAKDITMIVPIQLKFENIVDTIYEKSSNSIDKIELMNEYISSELPEQYHSISIRLYYRSNNKTLQISEIESIQSNIKLYLRDTYNIIFKELISIDN
uniref:phenylalanyl-tRNA synthetase beta subunit n=1 Tax=Dixoniella grisea TaxID=35153 RepID=UPI001FCE0308|nr:phenylalanyl-tRNA synthetase beta subunit [Dixoniella grisea]UNJ17078.1 phenylalanyl-tRNA synthetase beta subunit [Dixoniella grisea]